MKVSLLQSFILAFALMSFWSCAAQKNAMVASGNTYQVNSVISRDLQLNDNAVLVFGPKGRIRNCTITGKHIKIVPSGTSVAFENVTLRGSVVNSKLYATNFGAVSDMRSVSKNWELKGKKQKVKERTGTDNENVWKKVATFLSNSDGVDFEFNGSFFSSGTSSMYISGASNLVLHGGTLIKGFDLVDCVDVLVHHVSFVGFHEVHDFPTIYGFPDEIKKGVTRNGVKYTTANAFNGPVDRLKTCGIAGNSIHAFRKKEDAQCRNITIRNCHAEMRQDGFYGGNKSRTLRVQYFNVSSCTFSHIYFQPVSAYCDYATFDSIQADYCLQPIDFSTTANHCTVRNSRFLNCYKGPKQDSALELKDMSCNNTIDNCYFQINDSYFVCDSKCFLLHTSEGKPGDTFTMTNCTYEVNKSTNILGIIAKSAKTKLTNVNFIINLRNQNAKYALSEFLESGMSTLSPLIELNRVNVQINGDATSKVYCLGISGSSKVGKDGYRIVMNNCNFSGTARLHCAFSTMRSVEANNCSFSLPAENFIQAVSNVKLNGVTVSNVSKMCINAADVKNFNCDIQGCNFDISCPFLNLRSTSSQFACKNSKIKCTTFTQVKDGVSNRGFNMTGNQVQIKGSVAFSGMNATHKSVFTKNNFVVSSNEFTAAGGKSVTIVPSAVSSQFSPMLKNNRKGAGVR